MAEKKATKEAKIVKELMKQLQEKLAIIMEKNKALMDHQRKANEREKRLLELQQEVSKIFELETRMKKLKKMVSSQDDAVAA
ncbi:putative beta-galactosidase 7-like [Cocos nucifera]|uniref:Putative beta-galactosidase 7-like n=1 Tax=Cocos nucifera TaxID=13894 RepID=A0A8K0MWZ3_COCNU|nr:putative beta-galactosidase 7-like [Cocos nucifera]